MSKGIYDMFLDGIDISHNNGPIHWKSVPLSYISFVYMKATEGTTVIDNRFARNHSFLKKQGTPRGAYHFFRPTVDLALGRDAQSRNFLSVVKALGPGDLPPVLDVEVTDDQCFGVILDGVHRWLEKVREALGRMPMIYTNASFWNTALRGTGKFAKYPLWVANYTKKSTPHIPNGFTDYTFWQYSESGAIPGIKSNVDMNRFNGTRADLQSLAGLPPLSQH